MDRKSFPEINHVQKQVEELYFLKEWDLTVSEVLLHKYKEELIFKELHLISMGVFDPSNLIGIHSTYPHNNEFGKKYIFLGIRRI